MTLDHYQQLAAQTNEYPKERMLECLILGLASEAGELAGKLKKHYRGDNGEYLPREAMAYEAGDCLWYLSEIARELNYSFDQIAAMNLHKLFDRTNAGTIKGSGDDR